MAVTENVAITPGSGANIAADKITDLDSTATVISHQRVKLETGPDGVVYDVNRFTPIPISAARLEDLLLQLLVETRVLTGLTASNVSPNENLDALRDQVREDMNLSKDLE